MQGSKRMERELFIGELSFLFLLVFLFFCFFPGHSC